MNMSAFIGENTMSRSGYQRKRKIKKDVLAKKIESR